MKVIFLHLSLNCFMFDIKTFLEVCPTVLVLCNILILK